MTKAKSTKPTTKPVSNEVSAPKAGSKLDRILSALLSADGACLDEMIEATGWQPHTVRASMTALRKRGYAIEKRAGGNVTVWFIASGAAH